MTQLRNNLSFLTKLLLLLLLSPPDELLELALELPHSLQLGGMILLQFNELALEQLLLSDFLLGWLRSRVGVTRVDDVILFVVFLG